MASRTERILNPWALKAPNLRWAQNTYEGVVGLDPQGFIIFKDADSGRKAMDQEHRVEVGKNINVGEHLGTHVGAEVDSAGYEDALRNVPAIASQLSGQSVTVDTPLADIDPVVYKQAVARSEGATPEGMKTFFPEQTDPNLPPPDSSMPQETGTDYTRVYNKSDLLSNLVRFGAQNKDFMPDFLRQQQKMSNPLRGLVVDPMDDYSQLDLDISKDQRFTPENNTPPSETLFSRIQTPPTLQPDEAFDIGTQDSKDNRFSKWARETKRIQDANVAAEEEVDEVGVDETQDPTTFDQFFADADTLSEEELAVKYGTSASTEGDEIDQIITEEEQKASPTVAPKLTTTTPSSMNTEVPPATTARTDGMMGGKMLPTLLQALGAGGASYLENKAIKDANKATGQNQARANLINALARGGRAGAVTETPTTGMGTALFKSLSSLGEGEERRRKEAADEAYRQQRLDLDKEKLAADTENKKNVLAAKNTVAELRSHKDAVTQISEFLENGAKSGRVNYKNYKEQIAASPAIAQLFAQLPDSHKSLALSGLAIGLSTRQTPPEPVELKSMVQTTRDLYNAMKDPNSWLGAAGYKRLESLGELLYGTEGDFSSILVSQVFPAEVVFQNVRNANTLRLASAFNKGRPSDKDADLVKQLMPQFGLSEAVNEGRFAVLEQMAALAEEMAKTGFDPIAAGYGENFLTQSGAVIVGKDGVPKLDVAKLRKIFGTEPIETATTTSTGQQAKGKVIVKTAPTSDPDLPYDKTIQVKK